MTRLTGITGTPAAIHPVTPRTLPADDPWVAYQRQMYHELMSHGREDDARAYQQRVAEMGYQP